MYDMTSPEFGLFAELVDEKRNDLRKERRFKEADILRAWLQSNYYRTKDIKLEKVNG